MKRWWIVLLVLVLAAGAGAAWWVRGRTLTWTSDSPEAVKQVEAALDAIMKLYYPEAREHLERALELDPEFAAAKVFLAEQTMGAERERLVAELRRTDVEGLNRRERFLINDLLLRQDGETADADRAVDEYLAAHPEDPFALSTACSESWDRQDFERARGLYERLIAVDPNWVRARNNLGYIAMAQGRFEEAKRQFETYAYIAPDQPNPHDSMAELMALLGRYDEARAELEEALAVRPEFCDSYSHLLTVEVLAGQPQGAVAAAERARRHCDERLAEVLACQAEGWVAAFDTPPSEVWGRIPARCRAPEFLYADPAVRAALAAGETRVFDAYLSRMRAALAASREGGRKPLRLQGVVAHYEGLAALTRGRTELAIKRFQSAEQFLTLHGIDQGIPKLANRAELARAQERLGDTAAAAQTWDSINEINPRLLELAEHVPLYGAWPE